MLFENKCALHADDSSVLPSSGADVFTYYWVDAFAGISVEHREVEMVVKSYIANLRW